MIYTYQRMSGQGLRWDIFQGTRKIAICWSEDDAKLICKALNGGAAHD